MRILWCALLASACQTPKDIYIPVSNLPVKFADETVVSRAWKDGDYVYREGYTKDKDCIVARTPIVEYEGLYLMRMRDFTETCSGKGCSHCGFKSGGGCECKNSTNTCEHTITRNDVFLR